MDIQASLNDFREHMGGELTIPLIKGIGSLTETHHIDTALVKTGIAFLAGKYGRKDADCCEPPTSAPLAWRAPDQDLESSDLCNRR
jgi:hypothetical protein